MTVIAGLHRPITATSIQSRNPEAVANWMKGASAGRIRELLESVVTSPVRLR